MRIALNVEAQSFPPDFMKYSPGNWIAGESLLNDGGTSGDFAEIALGWV
jgi:hypothetical protein